MLPPVDRKDSASSEPARATRRPPPGAVPRPSISPLVAATVLVGFAYLVFGALVVASGSVDMPSEVRLVARFGMVFNIIATLVVGAAWVFRRPKARAVAAEGSLAPAYKFEDLDVVPDSPLAALQRTADTIAELDAEKNLDAIALVRELLTAGFSVGASDIHLTPEAERLQATFRVDGMLHDVGSVSARNTSFVINRIKVMANLSIHVRATPQDGRFTFDTEQFQARVSTLPTNHGEKVVVRLAVNDEARYSLETIGFDDETLTLYKTLLNRDNGVIYLTGPTGSGKTTTMYASLMYIRDHMGDKLNLVTLEDPMEVDFGGVSQTQVNNAVGLDFAAGLRSVLRQDPDVIMLGEIRDEETAQAAIRAGLTGHLLLTSVHADSTAGVFHRLLQLSVERFQMAGASIAVVNQRLAIRNCPDCVEKCEITELQKKQLGILGFDVEGDVYDMGDFYQGKGCPSCRGKGRRGRVPLIELLAVDDDVREGLIAEKPKHELELAAVKNGMRTLSMQAMALAREGVLPVDELIRVLSL